MNLSELLNSMTPSTLATLAVAIENVCKLDDEDFKYTHELTNMVIDAGVRNCGSDFLDNYFTELDNAIRQET